MSIKLRVIYLNKRHGHGNARRISVENCKNNLIAIMDADDISLSNRFEKQIQEFISNKKIDIVGGQITEFVDVPSNIIGKRQVPRKDVDIKKFMKKRCPMNQVTVMFKKRAVEKAGGYIDWFCNEDYYLWIRMMLNKSVFCNVQDTLVNVRVGNEMVARRGGWKYFKSEVGIQKYMLQHKIIGYFRCFWNILLRFAGEILITNKLRVWLFKLLRSNYNIEKEEKSQKTVGIKADHYVPFSVSMCVYGKDNAHWFEKALKSVTLNQTVKPEEVVLVVDGSIPQSIHNVINKYNNILGKE